MLYGYRRQAKRLLVITRDISGMAVIASEAIGAEIPQRYPRRAAVISWIFFDWAAQPYFTLITTFVFAPYFASFVAPNPATGQALWGFATAAAGLTIALLSPVLGAIADASGRRKPWIAGFGALLVIGSSLMWIGKPGDPSIIPPLLLAYAIASVGVEFATVFNNAMMPTLVPPDKIGRLSGTGWATGYIGGIFSLILVLGFLAANPETGRTLFGFAPLFGLDPVTHQGDRITGPLTGIWFIIFALPMFLLTPDYPAKHPVRAALREGLTELKQTLGELPKQKSMATFLLANMIYTDGLVSLFAFGGIYAAGTFGWHTIQIGTFGIILAIAGTFGAWLGGAGFIEQHERRGDAGRRDRGVGVGLVLALHLERADVDDAGEFADAVEEQREVVIRPFELQRDRPLGVQLFGDRRRRLEALDGHVRLRGHRLHAVQQVGGVLLFGQDRLEVGKAPFEVGHLRAELRQFLRRAQALVDVVAQRHELRLPRDHVGLHRHLVVVVENSAASDRQADKGPDLGVPRQLGERQFHVRFAIRAYRDDARRPLNTVDIGVSSPLSLREPPALPFRRAPETRP